MKRTVKTLALLLAFISLAIVAYIVWDLWRHNSFAEKTFDTQAPSLPITQLNTQLNPRLLIFNKTNHYRHRSIPAATEAIRSLAEQRGWAVFVTENAAIHNPAQLAEFDLLVWNNNTGNVLLPDQQAALKQWLESGGRWLGLHGAGGNLNYAWPWRADSLVGARFSGHTLLPQVRSGELFIEQAKHPVTAGLPEPWLWEEEWYSFKNNPRSSGSSVLISVKEASYKPGKLLQMGDDHPVVWTHAIGNGQAAYSALGHRPESWHDANHRRLLGNLLDWLVHSKNQPHQDQTIKASP